MRLTQARSAWRRRQRWATASDYLKMLVIFLITTLFGLLLQYWKIDDANIVMLYLVGVLVTASVTRSRACSNLYSVCSVIGFIYFFAEPKFSLLAENPEYPLNFATLLVVSLLTGNLVNRIRRQARESERAAHRTGILLETNLLLQKESDSAGIAAAGMQQLVKLTGRTVLYYAADDAGTLSEPAIYPPEAAMPAAPTARLRAAYAALARDGFPELTPDDAGFLYLPVRTQAHRFGVAMIVMQDQLFDPQEEELISSILGECALALEKEYYHRRREEAAIWARNEQMRADLLRSISHDLRTPLTSISGSARVLMTAGETLPEARRQALYTDIYDDSVWLIDLVENLLAVTRVKGQHVSLALQPELVDEVIEEALRHVRERSTGHTITVEQEDVCLLARMDARLIVQVIVNMVTNATKYTPRGTCITVRAMQRDRMAVIEVADEGPGIPDDAKARVFDMFYTVGTPSSDSRRGTGLGLALCRSIMQAHGGEITVRDNTPHGAVFAVTLPIAEE